MGFLKRVAKWASIWTVVAVVFLVFQDVRHGNAVDPAQVITGAVVIWPVMAALVALSQLRRAARRVGSNLGHAAFQAATANVGTTRERLKHARLPETRSAQADRAQTTPTKQ